MDTTDLVEVPHGLADFTKIRAIDVIIRIDGDAELRQMPRINITGGTGVFNSVDGGIGRITSTFIDLRRVTGAGFDNGSYDQTSFNRGWITIWYVE
jgi:hypothetical protein